MKRKLNRRQQRRIHNRQAESAQRSRRRDKRAPDEPGQGELGPEQPGVVISHFGQQLEIEALRGEARGRTRRCHQRANLAPLVAGDRVVWRAGDPTGVVVAGLPRDSVLMRPAGMGELRPVAANIDTILIVIAARPEPFANLIDRYLVAAEDIAVRPCLVLNKFDLLDADSQAAMDRLLALYEAIDYPVLRVSARSGQGLDALRKRLDGHTSIFVGQSGVGKSALINALLPGVDTQEGELSEAGVKGRHTTTSARLFHFPAGGDLIDSPGIREFGLGHLAPATLLHGFIEFRPFLGLCRFRDCRHGREPGCALRQAVEDGAIDPARMHSYRQILASLEPGDG